MRPTRVVLDHRHDSIHPILGHACSPLGHGAKKNPKTERAVNQGPCARPNRNLRGWVALAWGRKRAIARRAFARRAAQGLYGHPFIGFEALRCGGGKEGPATWRADGSRHAAREFFSGLQWQPACLVTELRWALTRGARPVGMFCLHLRMTIWGVLLACIPAASHGQVLLTQSERSDGTSPPSTSVTLAWKPSPSAVTGYYLSWGLVSGQCTNRLETGVVTNATVGRLETGVTYYFTVAAHDDLGRVSVPSNEVKYPPGPAPPSLQIGLPTTSAQTNASLRLTFQGVAGTTYEVQTTEDFQSWETVWATNCMTEGQITFSVADFARYPRRFFRVRQ